MDSFPGKDEEKKGDTALPWRPSNIKVSTGSLLCDEDQGNIPLEKIPMLEKIAPKVMLMPWEEPEALATSCTTTVLDLKMGREEPSDDDSDITPPRKPQRQTTDEIMKLTKGQDAGQQADTLQGLLLLRSK